jgi:hypothetical protein
MPAVKLTSEMLVRKSHQALLFGPPDSGKTRSLVFTAPYPLGLISCPGEEGWGSIPLDVPGLNAFVWEEDPSDVVTANSIRTDVETTTYQLLAGKMGPIKTLAIDGFHQLYRVYLNVATNGAFGAGQDFEPRLYATAHELAGTFLRKVLASPTVEYLIVTTWNAPEADEPGKMKSTTHEFPDLPGKMARRIGGYFTNKIFSKRTNAVPGQPVRWEWNLKPDTKVWGADIKIDARLYDKVPQTYPEQNWTKLFGMYDKLNGELVEMARAARQAKAAQVVN